MKRNRRVFGSKINCKSLSCAPINELGVVCLFGMLHDAFDFEIESIQSGFPDCIARRYIGSECWEELRIEFKFKSRTFFEHKHNPDKERPFRKLGNYGKSNEVNVIRMAINGSKNNLLSP